MSSFDADDERWTIVVPLDRAGVDVAAELTDATSHIARSGGGLVHCWVQGVQGHGGVDDDADELLGAFGFVAHRDLWQLRCPLPAPPSTIETRAFTAADAEALVRVNNRAFSWHPEQGSMTAQTLAATQAEPWYDPEGFRLYEHDGELLGFCWTKIHSDVDPVLGEIFVIAVDPAAHGHGLGSPMTRAGLDWLSNQGIECAMLYVESDNDPANRTYERIGFRHHRTDRAYNRTIRSSIA